MSRRKVHGHAGVPQMIIMFHKSRGNFGYVLANRLNGRARNKLTNIEFARRCVSRCVLLLL